MFRFRPLLFIIAFLLLFAILFCPRCVYAEVDNIELIWDDIQRSIELGKLKKVIPLLQGLLSVEEERPFALETLALTYLKLENDGDAIDSFQKLIGLPEYEHYANTLISLYYDNRQYTTIIKFYEENEQLLWDQTSRDIIETSYLATEIFDVPLEYIGADQDVADVLIPYSFGLNFFTTRYPAFDDSDDFEDVEYSTETYLKFALPITSNMSLTPRVSVIDERSNDNPASISNFRIQSYRAKIDLETRFNEGIKLRIGAGTFFTDSAKPDIFEDIDFGSKWLFSGAVSKKTGAWTAILGGDRNYFGDPGRGTYNLETITSGYIRNRLKISNVLDAELNYWYRRFTGGTEDYQQVDGLLRYYPERFPHFAINLGAEHEFRDRDENILKVGLEWVGGLRGSNQFFLTTQFDANFDSGERELEFAGFYTRSGIDRNLSVGLVVDRELKLDDRTDVFVVLSIGKHRSRK